MPDRSVSPASRAGARLEGEKAEPELDSGMVLEEEENKDSMGVMGSQSVYGDSDQSRWRQDLCTRVFHVTPLWCLQLLPLVFCCVLTET